jgi:hypothetical protein
VGSASGEVEIPSSFAIPTSYQVAGRCACCCRDAPGFMVEWRNSQDASVDSRSFNAPEICCAIFSPDQFSWPQQQIRMPNDVLGNQGIYQILDHTHKLSISRIKCWAWFIAAEKAQYLRMLFIQRMGPGLWLSE